MGYTSMAFGDGDKSIELLLTDEPLTVGDKSVVGMATSPIFMKKVGLVLDQTAEDERDYDFAALTMGADDTPFVYMEQSIMDGLIEQTDEALAVLLHELGHYYCGHRPKGAEERYEERLSRVKSGSVLESELVADGFATEYLGKDVVLSGFVALRQRMVEKYTEKSGYDPEIAEMSILELENRIGVLKSN